MDHKTAGIIGEDYFDKLDTDPQVSNYICFSALEAREHDKPWKNINECLYQALRKVAPNPPSMLKSGLPSLNRTEESTTAQMFSEFITSNNLEVWYETNEKAQSYYNWLVKIGYDNFIQRRTTFRSPKFLENTYKNVQAIAQEMLSDDLVLYPRFTNEKACTKCAFRGPCLAVEDGADVEFILDNNYEENRGR